eukprot:3564338-Amphidinium_carterae.2
MRAKMWMGSLQSSLKDRNDNKLEHHLFFWLWTMVIFDTDTSNNDLNVRAKSFEVILNSTLADSSTGTIPV